MMIAFAINCFGWYEEKEFRWAPLNVPAGKAGFTTLNSTHTGILWTNIITEQAIAKNYNIVSGAGVAAGDYDGDGLPDLYFCNRGGENALFRNIGNAKFERVAPGTEIALAGRSSTGAVFADVNGDGFLDLVVNSFFGTNSLFLNAGSGTLTNATRKSGLLSRGGATSLAFSDLDGDGDLDLYVAYFGIEAVLREGGRVSYSMVNGQPVVTGRHARRLKVVDGRLVEFGEQDVLYLNDGFGHFTPAKWSEYFFDENGKSQESAPLDFGLAVQIRDINEDGSPDIFVCNDFHTPDRAWLNNGKGQFRAMPRLFLRNMSYASMGLDFADIDRDGKLDFMTVDMLSRDHQSRLRQLSSMPAIARRIGAIDEPEEVPRNALFWNRGDGTYAEIAWLSGLAASDWSWTPIFMDVDLDGFEDLLVSAGSLYDLMDRDANAATKLTRGGAGSSLAHFPRLETRNAAFRNKGDLTFEDVTESWGFTSRQISHGMAAADVDNDGDLDLAINCANTPPLIYRNDSSAPRVAVRLRGASPNTQGIGAKVKLLGGAVPMQSQEIISGGRYLSGDDPMRVFAAGRLENEMKIEVTWRSGKKSAISGVKANRIYEIGEPQ
jgi:enediyne biosynthesis protein E4